MNLPIQPTERLCCFPLEAGIKVWGWISVVLSALSAIVNLFLLCSGGDTADQLEQQLEVKEGMMASVALVDSKVIYAVSFGVALLGIAASYMLVMAVNQRKRSYLLPYLISSLLSILFWVIILLPIVILLAPIGVIAYLSFCVHSLFVRLRMEEEQQQNTNQYDETTKVTSPQYAN